MSSNTAIIKTQDLFEDKEVLLQISTELVAQLTRDDLDAANRSIYKICKMRESTLFQEIGRLTRDLHETLNGFSHDEKLETLMHESLPDAKKRLDYVVKLTEESAHKTITIIENCMPLVNNIGKQAQILYTEKAVKDELIKDELIKAKRNKNINTFLLQTEKDSKALGGYLTEVLMAQSYQDISGQVIQRVIKLVQDVEASLVAMIRTCGTGKEENKSAEITDGLKKTSQCYGPLVPGVNHTDEKNHAKETGENDIMKSQDDVDDLLSTLGF